MNIKSELVKNYSKESLHKIVGYAVQNPKSFKELMAIFLDEHYRLMQRATVPVEQCVKKNRQLLIPYLPQIIKLLSSTSSAPSLKRNLLRTLQYIDIPAKYNSKLLDICFSLLMDPKSPIAVRVFSMTVAANISSNFPEIKKELFSIISDRMPYESPGFVSRGKRILKQLTS